MAVSFKLKKPDSDKVYDQEPPTVSSRFSKKCDEIKEELKESIHQILKEHA